MKICQLLLIFDLQLRIEQKIMFRFLLDSQYRRIYNQLEPMDLFTNLLPLKMSSYQQYFHHLVIIDPSIHKQLGTFPLDKLTPIKTFKILTFIHCWLQATCVIEDAQPVIKFINNLLSQMDTISVKAKRERSSSERRMSNNKISAENKSDLKHRDLEMGKQEYLLDEICKPYITYLQKLISRFDFYNSLKKNFIKPMNHSEIWVLVNLFNCINKVINCLPTVCNFIRKSYRPIAEALATTFSQDLINFYPKLYKYCYNEVNKVRSSFFELENEKGEEFAYRNSIQNVDLMVNLLSQVEIINNTLNEMYEQPVIQHMYNIYQPKMIDVQGKQFEFVKQLESIKTRSAVFSGFEDEVTPKFKTVHISRCTFPSVKTEERVQELEHESREISNVMNVFKDISNQDCNNDPCGKHIVVPLRRREREADKVATFDAQNQGEKGSKAGNFHRRVLTIGQIQPEMKSND